MTATDMPDIETLLQRVIAMRPKLRALQAETEERTCPSKETYEAFKAAGLFHVMTPVRFGGFGMSLRDFYRIVIEVARSCPSTGWWYALGAAHTVQICSYCEPETQAKVFAFDPDFSGPWTFSAQNAQCDKVEGGYRVSGTWHFASGVPHSSFMMAGIPGSENGKYTRGDAMTVLVPRGSFEIVDNWGDIIGMRGSGSNSVRIADVFVPDDMVFFHTIGAMVDGPTPGSTLHEEAFFGGAFGGFAEGGLAAVAVGTGFAALDEYEELLRSKKSVHKSGVSRLEDPEFLRKYGMGLVTLEAARGIVLNGAETYLRNCELSVSGQEPFDALKCAIMDGTYHACENIVFDVIDSLGRSASSTAFRQGQRMQRYYRDILTLTSRADFFEFRAADVARMALDQNAVATTATPAADRATTNAA